VVFLLAQHHLFIEDRPPTKPPRTGRTWLRLLVRRI
jgi:hypothetical protein